MNPVVPTSAAIPKDFQTFAFINEPESPRPYEAEKQNYQLHHSLHRGGGVGANCSNQPRSSATWLLSPQNSAWENANSWTPGEPPNGPSDIATFAQSSQTNVNI